MVQRSYLHEQDALRQQLGVKALQRKMRMDLDQQVAEKAKRQEYAVEEDKRYYENSLMELERWKEQEQLRQDEKQQRIVKEKIDRDAQLEYERKLKDEELQKKKDEEASLVEKIVNEMELEQRRYEKKKEQTKRTMRKVFEENMEDQRRRDIAKKEATEKEAETMKEYNRLLDEQEEQRAHELAARMERQSELMKKLQENVDTVKKGAGDNDAQRAALQAEEQDRHYFEAESVKQNRLQQMRLENQAYLLKQMEEKDSRKNEEKYLQQIQAAILERDAEEYNSVEKQKVIDRRVRNLEHRKDIERQMEYKARQSVPEMSEAEIQLNRPLLELVERTLQTRDEHDAPQLTEAELVEVVDVRGSNHCEKKKRKIPTIPEATMEVDRNCRLHRLSWEKQRWSLEELWGVQYGGRPGSYGAAKPWRRDRKLITEAGRGKSSSVMDRRLLGALCVEPPRLRRSGVQLPSRVESRVEAKMETLQRPAGSLQVVVGDGGAELSAWLMGQRWHSKWSFLVRDKVFRATQIHEIKQADARWTYRPATHINKFTTIRVAVLLRSEYPELLKSRWVWSPYHHDLGNQEGRDVQCRARQGNPVPPGANQHGSTARVDAERRHLQNRSLEQLKTEFHAAHPRKRRERPPFWAPNLVFPIRSAMDEAAVPLAVRVEQFVQKLRSPEVLCGNESLHELSTAFMNCQLLPPMAPSEYLEWLKREVLDKEVAIDSPMMMGHMTNTLPDYMPEMGKLVTALNLNLVKTETGKATTFLEREALALLHREVFQKEEQFYEEHMQSRTSCLGTMTSGGTTANIQALWMARNRAFPEVEQRGLVGAMKGWAGAVVLASELAHYSLAKAMRLLGLGSESLIRIPTDETFRVDVKAMEEEIHRCQAAHLKVLAVVGLAGATETGSVDDLEALAALAERFDVHFHVDAAWGGGLLFGHKAQWSPNVAGLFRGVRRAHTVSVDGHKLLCTPMGAGTLLIRDPCDPGLITNSARYIIREDSFDQGRFTLEGSRPAMAIYLHMNLRCLGREGLALRVQKSCELARRFWELLSDGSFEGIAEPSTNIVLYRYIPQYLRGCEPSVLKAHGKALDEFQISLQAAQSLAGRSFVSRTSVRAPRYGASLVCLRAVFGNMAITEASLVETLREQEVLAQQIEGLDKAPGTDGPTSPSTTTGPASETDTSSEFIVTS
ncbi:unnamed protein product [Durusdinium trenchii]|uniref:Trichohyalin-plectin-homology domain-containing protein n=1 Tax=Durusdinium trenchii TaxID=1381693 RepID=A0ABP0KEI6_9DINO